MEIKFAVKVEKKPDFSTCLRQLKMSFATFFYQK
jgi:hypothetical protein